MRTRWHRELLCLFLFALGATASQATPANDLEIELTKIEGRVTEIEDVRAQEKLVANQRLVEWLQGINGTKAQIAHDEGEAQGLFLAFGLVQGIVLLLVALRKKTHSAAPPAPIVVVPPTTVPGAPHP